MNYRLIAFVALFYPFASWSDDPQRSLEQLDAIQNFNAQGLSWGATIADLKGKFTEAKLKENRSDQAIGKERWEVASGLDGVNLADFEFLDGKLFCNRHSNPP